ncbi:MAG: hypothetical protein NZ805_07025 [Armatimonadetes bacterium]|nr:hypothetical protein [Armatimonadota bacterium]MDW8027501.1 hypothetical protein [Armatimonadota bacterium]
MRWLICLLVFPLSSLIGCERIQRGEFKVAVHSPEPPKATIKKVKPVEGEPIKTETPTQEQTVTTETAKPEVQKQSTEPETVEPQPTVTIPKTSAAPTSPVEKQEFVQPTLPSASELIAVSFADEARSVRASADTLQSQFDKLPVGEIRSRLLLLNQAISELEVRSPALVLWRTALRLEVMSKSPYPDVASARNWLARAKAVLAEQKVGLTALANSEKALKNSDWKSAYTALRDAATRLKAFEQGEALTQARLCLLNALEALDRQKNSVAKAEIGEAVKALDRLISVLP